MRAQPHVALLALVVTALASAGLCAGAILAPAPAMAIPLVVITSVGAPIFAGWQAPGAIAALRAQRANGNALAVFRRRLRDLPETEHPLGL